MLSNKVFALQLTKVVTLNDQEDLWKRKSESLGVVRQQLVWGLFFCLRQQAQMRLRLGRRHWVDTDITFGVMQRRDGAGDTFEAEENASKMVVQHPVLMAIALCLKTMVTLFQSRYVSHTLVPLLVHSDGMRTIAGLSREWIQEVASRLIENKNQIIWRVKP